MADVVDRQTRSRMMSGISGKDTRPEILIRKALFARGLRYRLHVKGLPGKPDLVFPRYSAVIFVNGCFWHGHGCHLFKWPATRKTFWRQKIGATIERDTRAREALKRQGWRCMTVWECALKGRHRLPVEPLVDALEAWVRHGASEEGTGDVQMEGQSH